MEKRWRFSLLPGTPSQWLSNFNKNHLLKRQTLSQGGFPQPQWKADFNANPRGEAAVIQDSQNVAELKQIFWWAARCGKTTWADKSVICTGRGPSTGSANFMCHLLQDHATACILVYCNWASLLKRKKTKEQPNFWGKNLPEVLTKILSLLVDLSESS